MTIPTTFPNMSPSQRFSSSTTATAPNTTTIKETTTSLFLGSQDGTTNDGESGDEVRQTSRVQQTRQEIRLGRGHDGGQVHAFE